MNSSFAGLSNERVDGVIAVLNLVLADECLLYTRTRNFHGCIDPAVFPKVSRTLADQFDRLSGIVDLLAGEVRHHGSSPWGIMTEFLQHTRCEAERIQAFPSPEIILRELIQAHESLQHSLRGDSETCWLELGNARSRDLLFSLVDRHEDMIWRLRVCWPSGLQNPTGK